jgi:hypothetical protein
MPQVGNSMSRIALTCYFAALLASCGNLSVNNIDWGQARLACADVGIGPGSSAFDQCVSNLYYSLWQEQNAAER